MPMVFRALLMEMCATNNVHDTKGGGHTRGLHLGNGSGTGLWALTPPAQTGEKTERVGSLGRRFPHYPAGKIP